MQARRCSALLCPLVVSVSHSACAVSPLTSFVSRLSSLVYRSFVSFLLVLPPSSPPRMRVPLAPFAELHPAERLCSFFRLFPSFHLRCPRSPPLFSVLRQQFIGFCSTYTVYSTIGFGSQRMRPAGTSIAVNSKQLRMRVEYNVQISCVKALRRLHTRKGAAWLCMARDDYCKRASQ